jgi:hypothetical protein
MLSCQRFTAKGSFVETAKEERTRDNGRHAVKSLHSQIGRDIDLRGDTGAGSPLRLEERSCRPACAEGGRDQSPAKWGHDDCENWRGSAWESPIRLLLGWR